MRIRVQPLEIEVPEHDPYQNDQLCRNDAVEALTHIVGNIEGPCALALDAPWGTGKTTFIRIWEKVLRKRNFPVVRINAWETDFSGEPFVALTSALDKGLSEDVHHSNDGQSPLKEAGKELLRRLLPGSIRLAAGIIPVVGSELGHAASSYAAELFDEYSGAEKSMAAFKETLKKEAATLSEKQEGRPLVVFVDELDRCRPTYAIELLEVTKHLFAVDKVVFVLAINRQQLVHSIRAVYGNDFDADGYLGRFFDIDLQLPVPDRSGFIEGVLKASRLDEYFVGSNGPNGEMPEFGLVASRLSSFFNSDNLALRDISQAIHRLGLVCLSLPSKQRPFAEAVLVALIVRTIDLDLYRRFIEDEVSDKDVVDAVRDLVGSDELGSGSDWPWFEAMIIAWSEELRGTDLSWDKDTIPTPLLEHYGEVESAEKSSPQEKERAKAVIRMTERIRGFYRDSLRLRMFGFKLAVERLELLSTEFGPSPKM